MAKKNRSLCKKWPLFSRFIKIITIFNNIRVKFCENSSFFLSIHKGKVKDHSCFKIRSLFHPYFGHWFVRPVTFLLGHFWVMWQNIWSVGHRRRWSQGKRLPTPGFILMPVTFYHSISSFEWKKSRHFLYVAGIMNVSCSSVLVRFRRCETAGGCSSLTGHGLQSISGQRNYLTSTLPPIAPSNYL
jgi:hypothetical protein